MKKLLRLALGASFLLALTACQQESSPTPTSTTVPAAPPTNIAATTSPLLTIDPATMASCDPAEVADVKWNVRQAKNDVTAVEVWVGANPAKLQLFAAGGANGESKTGPWTRPGTHFVLKNKANGTVLGEAIVGGPSCH